MNAHVLNYYFFMQDDASDVCDLATALYWQDLWFEERFDNG